MGKELTLTFPKHLPKAWIEEIERNGKVGSEVHAAYIQCFLYG